MARSSTPSLRIAIRSDIPQVLSFWSSAAENRGRPTDDARAVDRLIERDPNALVLAEIDGKIVGSLICGWDGWRYHLYRLAVHPDWRRHGIGGLLLADAERRCVALGASRVDAMVLSGNRNGTSFWSSTGYRVQDDWRRWVKPLER